MRRRIVAATLVIAAAIVAACSDVQSPTAPSVDGSALMLTIAVNGCVDQKNLSDLPAVDTEIKQLITGLFADQNQRSSTLSMWENLKKDKLESRPLLNHIDNLTKWTLEHYYAGTLSSPRADLNTTTGSMRLLDLVFRCAGETPTQVPAPPAGVDALISLVQPSTSPQTFTTPDNEAAAVIPALEEATLLALVPLNVNITTPFPKVSNVVDVALAGGRPKGANLSVLFCPFHDVNDARNDGIRVAHQKKPPTAPGGEVVEYLAKSAETHECHPEGGFAFNAAAEKNPVKRGLLHFASLANKAWGLVGPKKVYAAHAGIGGLIAFSDDGGDISNLSPMVLVDTHVETEIVIAEIDTTTYGRTVKVDAQLKVKSIPNGNCEVLPHVTACDWVGQPVKQLPGMPPLTLDALKIAATLGGSTQIQSISDQGNVHFDFTHLNAGVGQIAALHFDAEINVPANAPSFSQSDATASYTIFPRKLTVTAVNHTWVYGSATAVPAGDFTADQVQYSDVVTPTFTTEATDTTQAGPYPLAVKANVVFVAPTLASNYDVTKFNADLNVTKAQLTVTADDKERFYFYDNPALTTTVVGIENEDAFTATSVTGATKESPVIPAPYYTITPSITGDRIARNYIITYHDGHLRIKPRPLTVNVAAPATVVYGTAATFSATNNAVNGDEIGYDFTVTGTTTTYPNVGTYTVGATVSGASPNYDPVTVNTATMVVSPRNLTITVSPLTATRRQGEANPAITIASIAGDGLLGTDEVTAEAFTLANENSDPGTYDIDARLLGTAKTNYNVSVTKGTLTVEPAIDQQNWIEASTYVTCTDGQSLYQSFTPSATKLTALDLMLRVEQTSGDAITTTVTIRKGTPDGEVVGTLSSTPMSLTAGQHVITRFTPSAPLTLESGDTYVIEWTPSAYLSWGSGGVEQNTYAGGTAYTCGKQALASQDYLFLTYR